MKKVVLINQSTGYLMVDIVNAYASKYDRVSLMAGSIKVTERSLKDGVEVDKIIAYNGGKDFLKASVNKLLFSLFLEKKIV